MWKYPAVFVALFALDFVYARYNIATTTGRALASAHYAALIILLGGFGIVQYSHDPILLIPAALGAWFGTYVAVHYKGEIPMATISKRLKGWTVYRIKNKTARRLVLTGTTFAFVFIFLIGLAFAFACNIARAAWAATAATYDEACDGLEGCGPAFKRAWWDFS